METAEIAQEPVSNLPAVLEFRAGYSATASAASIAFLWTNWEILYRMSKGVFKVERVTETAWRGSGFGGRGEWHLLRTSIGVNYGRFEFFSWVRFLGTSARGMSIFEYKRVDANTVAYHGRAWGELPRPLRPTRWFVEALVNLVAGRVNTIGGGTAELLSRDPTSVKPYTDPDRYQTYLDMVDEERSIQKGTCSEPRFFFDQSDASQELTSVRNRINPLRKELKLLESELDSRVPGIEFSEYYKSLLIFEADPGMAVTKIRSILEPMVREIYETEFRQSAGQATLFDQVKRLYRESPNVPNHITSLMQTIVALGNIGVHTSSAGKVPSQIDFNEFRTSFAAIVGVTQWYGAYQTRGKSRVL
jgi:hypothetical protein